MKKRVLASLLACGLVLTLAPGALAAESAPPSSYTASNGTKITVTKLSDSEAKGYYMLDYMGGGVIKGIKHGGLDLLDIHGNVLASNLDTSNGCYSGAFSDGRCMSQIYDPYTAESRYGYYDTSGKIAIAPQYDWAKMFSEGRAAVQKDGKWGYIDTSGNLVIPCQYEQAYYFHDGLALVQYLEKVPGMSGSGIYHHYFIDQSGNIVLEMPQKPMPYYSDAGGYLGDFMTDVVLPVTEQFSGGYALLMGDMGDYRDFEFALMDRSGRITETPGLEGVINTSEYKSYVQVINRDRIKNCKSVYIGVVDAEGNVIVPYLEDYYYMSISNYCDGVAVVSTTEANYAIDADGKEVIPRGQWKSFRGSISYPNFDGTWLGEWGDQYYLLQIEGDGTVPPAPDTPSSWAAEQVNQAISAGIVPDSLQSQYTQTTTRAQFCALAVELYETVKGAEITQRTTFTDTDDVNVQKMGALGIVTGVGSGKFNPGGTLTREQAATMLSRLAEAVGKPLPAQAPTFADNGSVSSWAFDAVGQMQASGVMGGVGNNTFAPQDSYSREQSIITMLRLYEAVK